jgi:hypothetical protein
MEAHKVRYVQMQQSEKPDLGTGFLSVDLGIAGELAVASDLSWRNALVLPAKHVKRGNLPGPKENVTYLNALAEACHSRPISTRIRTHL